MRRYVDKVVAFAALVFFLTLITCQVVAMVSAHNTFVKNVAGAKDLRGTVDASNPPDELRDPASYSGKVFRAWGDLPFVQPITPWDLYPDQR